jgi:tripartite-type tricarboxylate transporter receptor subunit TctC
MGRDLFRRVDVTSGRPDIIARRRLLVLGLTTAALQPAYAKAWPTRPIRLVVPFPPGGLNDNMARLMAPRLQQELGQPVVIDNRAGAGGTVGAAEVAREAPDGYTLLIATPPLTIAPAIFPKLPYRPEQLAPVAFLGRVPNVLLVHPASGIGSVADLIALAKKSPGKMTYASAGNGTSPHLSAELMKATSGTFITHMPHRGSAPAILALMDGSVDMSFDNLSAVIGHIAASKVRPLAVTTRKRSKTLALVPTLAESGMPDFDVSAWFGLAAPAGLPSDVKARLEAAVEVIAADRQVLSAMERTGAEALFMNGATMASYMAADAVRWKQLAARNRITID